MSDDIPEREYYNFIESWQLQCQDNIKKWGWQDIETLLLATQEELGELTQSVLEYRYEDGSRQEMFLELQDVAALLFAIRHTLERGVERHEDGEEMGEETKKDLILALLRAKRTVKAHDLDLTAEMNRLQRDLEADVGVTGVELAPEYSVEQ